MGCIAVSKASNMSKSPVKIIPATTINIISPTNEEEEDQIAGI